MYLWQDISFREAADALDIANEVLWNNRHFPRDLKSLYNKNLKDKGILNIQYISNEVGELPSCSEAEQKFSMNRTQILNCPGPFKLYPQRL